MNPILIVFCLLYIGLSLHLGWRYAIAHYLRDSLRNCVAGVLVVVTLGIPFMLLLRIKLFRNKVRAWGKKYEQHL